MKNLATAFKTSLKLPFYGINLTRVAYNLSTQLLTTGKDFKFAPVVNSIKFGFLNLHFNVKGYT